MATKDQVREQWRDLADPWIEGTASGRNVYREGLLDAWMLVAVGDVSGVKTIDLGCGEGRFSRMLTARGAKVVGIDLCERFIEYAKGNRVGDEEYVVADMEDLGQFPDGRFDLAVSYVSLVDTPGLEKAVAEAHRVLRPGGRFVVCNLQPMCTAANAWSKDEQNTKLHFKLDSYFDEGPRDMRMFGSAVTNFHRTLSSYVNCFLRTGFVLEALQEPKPSPAQVEACPEVDDNLRVPYFMIYTLRKPEEITAGVVDPADRRRPKKALKPGIEKTINRE